MAVRVTQVGAEALTGGAPAIRVPMVGAEALTGGTPAIRVPLIGAEALTGGSPVIHVPMIGVEVAYLYPFGDPTVSTEIFPLGSFAWSVHLKPQFNTRVSTHVSGREKRQIMRDHPIWEITLTYEYLRSDGTQTLQAILNFFLARRGQGDDFLLDLGAVTRVPTDRYATNQMLGEADGLTTGFTLIRPGTDEPVGWVFPADLGAVTVGGQLADPASYSFTPPGLIVFSTAPAAGAGPVCATYRYYMRVRFAADDNDFEEFAANLWQLQELKLLSVLP